MNSFEYAMPKRTADVFRALESSDSIIKAGGIDVLDLIKEGIAHPQRLVNINSIDELKYIEGNQTTGVKIGPGTTLAELASSEVLSGSYRALAQAAGSTATPQIRNSATLGGSLCQRPRCWYFRNKDYHCTRKGGFTCFAVNGENENHAIFENDFGCVMVHPSTTAVALIALGAKLTIASAKSSREILVEDFFVTPRENMHRENILEQGEIITAIHLPPAAKNMVSYYYKQKAKQSFDWPIAEVAVSMQLDGKKCQNPRVALGAAAPVPMRSKEAESALNNQEVTIDIAASVGKEAMKKATPLSQNKYKVHIFQAVIKRTVCWASDIDPFA
ncbi:FAD binding domain-containing protein [Candidatus Uabimicrobium amorphum]|uniref:FAD-binding molybdopterin dehydrogenase n=1 Tax=Uabimicrobium amorphum TaxID=2596890 RepID=A0A5S9F3C7_UABAM|nr:FAD binding domain-containing protein [Candidatus Uabimicrobium amorphum]BBM84546.1 FAD-binding molybdopterin dehydrogenase [Candidatus Uabimicrobium amorphum]